MARELGLTVDSGHHPHPIHPALFFVAGARFRGHAETGGWFRLTFSLVAHVLGCHVEVTWYLSLHTIPQKFVSVHVIPEEDKECVTSSGRHVASRATNFKELFHSSNGRLCREVAVSGFIIAEGACSLPRLV